MNEEQKTMVLEAIEQIRDETKAEFAAIRADFSPTTSLDNASEEE